ILERTPTIRTAIDNAAEKTDMSLTGGGMWARHHGPLDCPACPIDGQHGRLAERAGDLVFRVGLRSDIYAVYRRNPVPYPKRGSGRRMWLHHGDNRDVLGDWSDSIDQEKQPKSAKQIHAGAGAQYN